jgi:hypothetical protein
MTVRLDVAKVIYGAFLFPWWHRRAFARALAIPLVLLVTLTLSWYLGARHLQDPPKWFWLFLILYIVYGALFSVFAVTCHRLVLLDTASVAARFVPRWSWRETRFFFFLAAVSILCTVAVIAPSILVLTLLSPWLGSSNESWPPWVSFALVVPVYYLFARLCLVFPATAIDRKVDLKWTWRLTRGNGWRLFVVVGVLPLVIKKIVELFYRENATPFETVILTLLGIALFAVEIAALSLSYRELTKKEGVEIKE